MAKKQYLEYQVHLTDAAVVAQLNQQYPNGVNRAPYNPGPPQGGMAIEAAEMIGLPGPLPYVEVGGTFVTPSLTSAWFTSTNQFPRNAALFRHSGGFFGGSGDTEFYWIARFIYSPATPVDDSGGSGEDVTEVLPIPARHYIVGGEINGNAEVTSSGTANLEMAPSAARFWEGFGLVFVDGGTGAESYSVNSTAGLDRRMSWDRFYFRARRFPSTSEEMFKIENGQSSGTGFGLEVTATGQLALYRWTGPGTKVLLGTGGQVTLNRRHRFDIITYMGPTIGDPLSGQLSIRVNVDREPTISGDAGITSGTIANIEIRDTYLGRVGTAPAAERAIFEWDDWVNANVPDNKDFTLEAHDPLVTYNAGEKVQWSGPFKSTGCTNDMGFEVFEATETTTNPPRNSSGVMQDGWKLLVDPPDWIGSHIVAVFPDSFGGAHEASNWAGDNDFRTLCARPRNAATDRQATSSTSGAIFEVETDIEARLSSIPGVTGIASFAVYSYSQKTTAALDSTIAGTLAGGGVASSSATESTTLGWRRALANNGTVTPWAVDALTLRYTKGADANASQLAVLCATIEVIGAFGDEDVIVDGEELRGSISPATQHTRHIPGTPWHRRGIAPFSPVVIIAGTYTGNGTGQDVSLPYPPTFLWIRPHSTTNSPASWWATMQSWRISGQQGSGISHLEVFQNPAYVAQDDDETDQQFEFKIRIGADSTAINGNGTTYQYLAFCDPGARFSRAQAVTLEDNQAPYTLDLEDSSFGTPLVAFCTREAIGTTATETTAFKGPGHATAQASVLASGTALTNGMTLGDGTVVLGTDFVTATDFENMALLAFRRSDGNNDPGEPGVFVAGTYTGDGSASRTIGFSPATGKRPVWLLVVPVAASNAIMRDPSHTGTTSQNLSGSASASTGITAGSIDGFTVGSSLNGNGTVYNYFGFVGGTTACNNGWGCNGTYIPVEPDSNISDDDQDPDDDPPDDDFPPDDDDDDDDDIILDDDPDFDDDTDLPGTDLHCVDFTQRVCNLALARIGHSKQIDNVATDLTVEARTARLIVKDAVEFTMERFPWPFATKYSTLTLIAGSVSDPVNRDWTYSYRQPGDCMFARRIVRARDGQENQESPAFQLARDTGGAVIFTNEANARLEYSARGLCPTYEGDRLYKEALAWKLAADFAPALTRMEDKVTSCLEKFEETIARAYEVIKPGNTGPVTVAAPTIDTSAASIAANLAVVNRALIRIGARTIISLSNDTPEARKVRTVFEAELQQVLRDHAWAFATRYAELALVAGPAGVDDALVQTWSGTRTYLRNDAVVEDGTIYYAQVDVTVADPSNPPSLDDGSTWSTTMPTEANADWIRAFRAPADSVFVRRLVRPGARRQYDPDPIVFKTGTDDGGEVVYSDIDVATAEYTARIDGAVRRADALFVDAFAWKLAAALAPSLAQVDPEDHEQPGRGPDATALEGKRPPVKASKAQVRRQVAQWALGRYYAALEEAKVTNKNQQQENADGDAPWILER